MDLPKKFQKHIVKPIAIKKKNNNKSITIHINNNNSIKLRFSRKYFSVYFLVFSKLEFLKCKYDCTVHFETFSPWITQN